MPVNLAQQLLLQHRVYTRDIVLLFKALDGLLLLAALVDVKVAVVGGHRVGSGWGCGATWSIVALICLLRPSCRRAIGAVPKMGASGPSVSRHDIDRGHA